MGNYASGEQNNTIVPINLSKNQDHQMKFDKIKSYYSTRVSRHTRNRTYPIIYSTYPSFILK